MTGIGQNELGLVFGYELSRQPTCTQERLQMDIYSDDPVPRFGSGNAPSAPITPDIEYPAPPPRTVESLGLDNQWKVRRREINCRRWEPAFREGNLRRPLRRSCERGPHFFD